MLYLELVSCWQALRTLVLRLVRGPGPLDRSGHQIPSAKLVTKTMTIQGSSMSSATYATTASLHHSLSPITPGPLGTRAKGILVPLSSTVEAGELRLVPFFTELSVSSSSSSRSSPSPRSSAPRVCMEGYLGWSSILGYRSRLWRSIFLSDGILDRNGGNWDLGPIVDPQAGG